MIEVDRGPGQLPEFITSKEALRRRTMARTIDGSFTENLLIPVDAPDITVSLSDGTDLNLRDEVLSLAGRIEDMWQEVEERRQQVRSDSRFTDEGKRNRIREIDNRFADWLRDRAEDLPVEALEERLEEMRGQLLDTSPRTNPDDSDRLDRHLREADRVQDRLYELEPQERLELALRAARSDDRVTLAALERAPESFPLLGADELAMVQETHARTRWPDRMERVDQIGTGMRRMKGAVNSVMGMLAQESGNPDHERRPYPASRRAEASEQAEAVLAEAQ